MSTSDQVKLVFGCGYLGSRVVRRWQQAGKTVRIVTRREESAERFRQQGLEAVVANIATIDSLSAACFEGVDSILFAVGFDRQGGSIAEVYVGGMENVLRACPTSVRQFVYISSTGVYGKAADEWVTEETATHPERAGGEASLAAERLLQASPLGACSLVLRLAGIYGPDRIPRLQDVLEGKPITAFAQSWLNLIHVEDAADIIVQAVERRLVGEVLNVSDGRPVQRREFYREIARIHQRPDPLFVEPNDTEATQTRGSDKKVCTDRLQRQLQPTFSYPSYREGLSAGM